MRRGEREGEGGRGGERRIICTFHTRNHLVIGRSKGERREGGKYSYSCEMNYEYEMV